MNTELVPGVNWVGVVDWILRDFHGYTTERGATYNSYLVRDEKIALIDGVKEAFAGETLARIAEHTPLESVDYVVCNHAEPDHSGGLPAIFAAMPHATLVCNAKCLKLLSGYYDVSSWKRQIIEDGETLSLGKRTLQFIFTPMVHWPESMFTWIPEEKVLFSMDAFGQHYATSHRFDEQNLPVIMAEAKTYYANIVMPYGKKVAALLPKARELDPRIIAPSHGLIWKDNVDAILLAYEKWSICAPTAKVVVIYYSMWESTARMARAICEGAACEDVRVKLIHVRKAPLSEIATQILDAPVAAFGTSTLNAEMMPMMSAVLTYLKGLKPSGKTGVAFGSHGWGRGGPEAVNEMLHAMHWDILSDPLKVKYRPTEETFVECRALGAELARHACAAVAGEDI
jgi:flavorubredoxin